MTTPIDQSLLDLVAKKLIGRSFDHPEIKRIFVAGVLLKHCLGEDFIGKRIRPSETPDPFMLNGLDDQKHRQYTFQHRMCSLAENLFILRSAKGLDELI